MCKFSKKSGKKRIDPCMKQFIKELNCREIETVMCCCGHGKYPMTVLVRGSIFKDHVTELFSGIGWPNNKKKFYKRDKQGYYYIPETI